MDKGLRILVIMLVKLHDHEIVVIWTFMKSYKLTFVFTFIFSGRFCREKVTLLDYILVHEYSYRLYRVIKHREYFYCHC